MTKVKSNLRGERQLAEYYFEDHCWKDIVDEKTLDIYKYYQREAYIGPKPALLVIDLYNLAYEGGPKPVHELVQEFPSSCGEHAWNALEDTQELIALARMNNFPIIYCTRQRDQSVSINSTHRSNPTVSSDTSTAYEIKKELEPQPEDLVIYKGRASIFFGTPLIAYLNQLDVGSLIICGQSTSGCVRASVVDAYSYGYHSVVVEECCFDRSMLSHKVSLFDLHHKYADVMHFDEVKSLLGKP